MAGSVASHAWRVNFGHAYEVLSNATRFSLGVVLALLVTRIGPGAVAMIALSVVLAWVGYRRVLRPLDEREDPDEERDAA